MSTPGTSDLHPRRAWRVRRTSGLLVSGFTKRFTTDGRAGMTYLWGVPIGRFDVREVADGPGANRADLPDAGPAVELVYRRWPVVDVLGPRPRQGGSIPSDGYIRVPGGHRLRFCRFRLER